MRGIKLFSLFIIIGLMVGCAVTPTAPKDFAPTFYEQPAQTVGVYVHYPDKVNTFHPGASCLLCMAAAEAANSSVTKQMQSLPAEDFADLAEQIAEKLSNNGMNAVVIEEPELLKGLKRFRSKDPNVARTDYRPLKQSHNIDTLIVVEITQMGSERTYSSYIPTGAPQGYVNGKAYAIDLTSNSIQMYQPLTQRVAVVGEWKESPSYPGLTTAYYQAVENVKAKVDGLVK